MQWHRALIFNPDVSALLGTVWILRLGAPQDMADERSWQPPVLPLQLHLKRHFPLELTSTFKIPAKRLLLIRDQDRISAVHSFALPLYQQ